MVASYTPEEMATIANGVTASGLAVAIADVGLVSTAIEAGALAQEVVNATKTFPHNSLIATVFSEENLKKNLQTSPGKDFTPDNAVDKAIAAINAALAIVNDKATPEEVTQYKQLVYAAADRVANAAGEGLFGSGAQKVSTKEAATLARLKDALGV